MKVCRSLAVALAAVLVAACGLTSKAPQPSPLPIVQNKLQLSEQWRVSLGVTDGARLQPVLYGGVIAVLSGDKRLLLLDAASGAERRRINLPTPVAGGAGLGEELIAIGTLKGELLAYGYDGKLRWRVRVGSEVIAPPTVTDSLVLVRGTDGRLTAHTATDGAIKWVYARQQPALQLRNFSAPVVEGGVVYYGQAGGRLAALSLKEGRVFWEAQVAQPRGVSEIERMADVVASPVVYGDMVCAVAYQGRLACFNAKNGSLGWSREISSYSGLAVDDKAVYVTDDKGNLIAYERASGRNLWRQDKLALRGVSGPAVDGNTLVVGDYQGFLHFIDTEDGSFFAQRKTDGGAIETAPQPTGGRWLIQTQKGGLSALTGK